MYTAEHIAEVQARWERRGNALKAGGNAVNSFATAAILLAFAVPVFIAGLAALRSLVGL